MTISRSLFWTVKFPGRSPTVPGLPQNNSWSVGIRSWAVQAVVTGIRNLAMTRSNFSIAPANRIPVPTIMTGREAAISLSVTSLHCAVNRSVRSEETSLSGVNPGRVRGLIFAAWTSIGISIQQGPGRPDFARYKAFSRWNRMVWGSFTITAYLVIPCTIGMMSTS